MTSSKTTPTSPGKTSKSPKSKWGRLDFSGSVQPALPAGEYHATIGDAKVIETDDALYLLLTFEIEFNDVRYSPENLWITMAVDPEGPKRNQLREGLRKLAVLEKCVACTLEGKEGLEIADDLIGEAVRVKLARRGQGIAEENIVRKIMPV
jgi:hypothetical protein